MGIWSFFIINSSYGPEAYIIASQDSSFPDTIFLVTKPWAPTSLQRFLEALADSESVVAKRCPWYQSGQLFPFPGILRQCLEAVHYLHSQRPPIRHKDIEPENILLEEHGPKAALRVIFIDFGISRYKDGATTSYLGTWSYLAPEQIKKHGPSPKSDVFSLECCFALLQAVILAGKTGILKGWYSAMETDSCQFCE
jgi:serine/threonine protein kinase